MHLFIHGPAHATYQLYSIILPPTPPPEEVISTRAVLIYGCLEAPPAGVTLPGEDDEAERVGEGLEAETPGPSQPLSPGEKPGELGKTEFSGRANAVWGGVATDSTERLDDSIRLCK